ncbi:MAG: T9SS type A sorting domain-containing protein, partial [Luteibaculum sp.]
ISVPSVPARGDTVIKIAWPKEFLPKISSANNEPEFDPSRKFYLLARLLHPQIADSGIAFPEVSSVLTNVRNNNNIVLRSFSIYHAEELSTSVQERDAHYAIRFYPNPVSNKLHLEIQNTREIQSIHILDLSGRTLREFPVTARIESDLSDWQGGIYLLKITGNKGSTVHKIRVD